MQKSGEIEWNGMEENRTGWTGMEWEGISENGMKWTAMEWNKTHEREWNGMGCVILQSSPDFMEAADFRFHRGDPQFQSF
jgi:hypothetical protein